MAKKSIKFNWKLVIWPVLVLFVVAILWLLKPFVFTKTYVSPEGFSFKYPVDWKVTEYSEYDDHGINYFVGVGPRADVSPQDRGVVSTFTVSRFPNTLLGSFNELTDKWIKNQPKSAKTYFTEKYVNNYKGSRISIRFNLWTPRNTKELDDFLAPSGPQELLLIEKGDLIYEVRGTIGTDLTKEPLITYDQLIMSSIVDSFMFTN